MMYFERNNPNGDIQYPKIKWGLIEYEYHKMQENIQQRIQKHIHIQELGSRKEEQENLEKERSNILWEQNRRIFWDCQRGESKAKERSKRTRAKRRLLDFGCEAQEFPLVDGYKVTSFDNTFIQRKRNDSHHGTKFYNTLFKCKFLYVVLYFSQIRTRSSLLVCI